MADKCITADYRDLINQDVDQLEFLDTVKKFAKSQLKDWPKNEFKLNQFLDFCDESKISVYRPSFDYEKQKLTKTYVDLLQKQYIFDEVLKIIEEEGIDVENLFLAAFQRLGEAALREEESLEADSQPASQLTESRQDSDRISYQSDRFLANLRGSKTLESQDAQGQPDGQVAPGDQFKLNFSQLKDHEGVPGFHEEFMGNMDNFSLSWRLQAMKDMERGNRRESAQAAADDSKARGV